MQATAAATQNTVGQVGDSVEKRALWDIDRSSVLAAMLIDARDMGWVFRLPCSVEHRGHCPLCS